jgi:hypothetical protein
VFGYVGWDLFLDFFGFTGFARVFDVGEKGILLGVVG